MENATFYEQRRMTLFCGKDVWVKATPSFTFRDEYVMQWTLYNVEHQIEYKSYLLIKNNTKWIKNGYKLQQKNWTN